MKNQCITKEYHIWNHLQSSTKLIILQYQGIAKRELLANNDDKSNSMDYDQDNDKKHLLYNNMAKVPAKNNDDGAYESQYAIGTQIEARYNGKTCYYPGKICSFSSRDGTYGIDYDHGERQHN